MIIPRNKPDLVKLLAKLGYDKAELEELTVAQLKELATKEKKAAKENVGATDSEESDESEEELSGDKIVIVDAADKYVRDYNPKEHGKDFKALAKQFLKKFPKYHVKK